MATHQLPITSGFEGQPPIVPSGATWVPVSDSGAASCEHGGYWTWSFSIASSATPSLRFSNSVNGSIDSVNSTANKFIKSIYQDGLVAPDDRVVTINGRPIVSSKQAKLFIRELRGHSDPVEIEIQRYVGVDGSLSPSSFSLPHQYVSAAPFSNPTSEVSEVCNEANEAVKYSQRRASSRKREFEANQVDMISSESMDTLSSTIANNAKAPKPNLSHLHDAGGSSKVRKTRKSQPYEGKRLLPQTSLTEPLCISDSDTDADDSNTSSEKKKFDKKKRRDYEASTSTPLLLDMTEPLKSKRSRGGGQAVTRLPMTMVSTAYGTGIVINTTRPRKGVTIVEIGLSFGKAFLQPQELRDYLPGIEQERTGGGANTSASVVPFLAYPTPLAKGSINIHAVDLLRLTPGVYLNDNIIDFGLKYLFEEARISTSRKFNQSATRNIQSAWIANTSRFHYFSQFFFNRLTEALKTGKFFAKGQVKKQLFENEQKSEWSQLKRWSRNQDVLCKDYLVVPINKDEHWSVAIVCNPGSIRWCLPKKEDITEESSAAAHPPPSEGNIEETCRSKDATMASKKPNSEEDLNEGWGAEAFNKRPCIVFLDSAKYHHSQTVFKHIRKYLQLVWDDGYADKYGSRVFDAHSFPGFSPKVPQQINNCDCGVYLLQFVELILADPPIVSPEFIMEKGNILTKTRDGVKASSDHHGDNGEVQQADSGGNVEEGSEKYNKSGDKGEWFPLSAIGERRRDIKYLLESLGSKQMDSSKQK